MNTSTPPTAADLPRLSANLHDILGKVQNHGHVSNWPVNHAQELDQLLKSGQIVLALAA